MKAIMLGLPVTIIRAVNRIVRWIAYCAIALTFRRKIGTILHSPGTSLRVE